MSAAWGQRSGQCPVTPRSEAISQLKLESVQFSVAAEPGMYMSRSVRV